MHNNLNELNSFGDTEMAYASKELKAKVSEMIKDLAKKLGIKATVNISIKNYSKLDVNIKSCSVDLRQNILDTVQSRITQLEGQGCYPVFEMDQLQKVLNKNLKFVQCDEFPMSLEFDKSEPEKHFSGEALEFIKGVLAAIKCDYYNNSDYHTDYFDHAYYWSLSIGKNKGGFIHKV